MTIPRLLLLPLLLLTALTASAELLLSGPLSPETALELDRTDSGYRIRIRAENPYARLSGRLGVAAERAVLRELERFPAELEIPFSEIGENAPLRLALELAYFNADGSLRQREVFLAPAFGDRLPEDFRFWQVFDYDGYRAGEEARAREIAFSVEQPFPGKLSVVIEKPDGTRVRNLISGLEYAPGKQRIVWDGRDEFGNLVAPGEYRFRAVSHPGLRPEFQMQFANGDETMFTPFGSNHGTMTAVTANRRYVFAAAPITEGGWAIVALTPEGRFVRGFRQISGCGIQEVFLAADERRLYVINDGRSWSGKTDPPCITLSSYDPETGNIVAPRGSRAQLARLYVGTARSTEPGAEQRLPLRGAALCGGKLYLANGELEVLMEVDPETGRELRKLKLPAPGPLAADRGKLYAISGRELGEFDPADGRFHARFSVPFPVRGLTVGPDGFYLTGAPDHTVKVFAPDGKLLRSLGEPGGPYAGAWRPDRLVRPVGLAFDAEGKLWLAEKRENPKRLVRLDPTTGKALYSKIGCPPYGSPGVGFDPEHGTRWIGQSCLWELDPEVGTSRITSVLQPAAGHLDGRIQEPLNYRFVHRDGRTFVLGSKSLNLISELRPDGTLRDLAILTDVVNFYRGIGYRDDPAFLSAVKKVFPKASETNKFRDPSCRYAGLLWVDRNGNGKLDEEEFEFTPPNVKFGHFGWGQLFDSLELTLPYQNAAGEQFVLTLKPDGYLPSGAPNYSLQRTLSEAKKLSSELPPGSRSIIEGAMDDGAGGILVNTSPYLFSLTRDGRIRWFYRNLWTGVHGSHNAPLPRPGELQGVLFGLGTAPLDDQSRVAVFAGNHGRYFVFTTDGIYLDEMFSDCRVAEVVGPGLIGGEAFGGNFAFDAARRRYRLSAGSSGYRIYNLKGLEQLRRQEGTIQVSSEQLAAAARLQQAAPPDAATRTAHIARLSGPRPDLRKQPVAADWSTADWPLRVWAGYDAQNLYLEYQVADHSPWLNRGDDWTLLFKTGDSVDFQFSTDPAAPAGRAGAANGDRRLLIAPFRGRPAAVLYTFTGPVEGQANPVEFTSPWRSFKVADVRLLKSADIKVETAPGSYRVTVSVPLRELGLTDPAGAALSGDFGVIYGDQEGTVNLSRRYWSNQATGLVNDIPGEIMPDPRRWGILKFGE